MEASRAKAVCFDTLAACWTCSAHSKQSPLSRAELIAKAAESTKLDLAAESLGVFFENFNAIHRVVALLHRDRELF